MSLFRNELEPLNHNSGKQLEISFDHHDIEIEDLRVYAHHNDEKTNLPVKDKFFDLPEEEGDYIIVVKLLTDKGRDRKSTRLNSSHVAISYAVFCLKKKNKNNNTHRHKT